MRFRVAAREGAEERHLQELVVGERRRAVLAEARAQAVAVAMEMGSPPASSNSGIRPARATLGAAPGQPRAAGGRQRENLDARRRDADRVLELRRERAVARHGGPAVGQELYVRAAEIDHRLDGEDHAGPDLLAFAGLPVMQHVGRLVEEPADAVAAEIAHHRAALGFRKALDGMADIAEPAARADGGDAAHQAFVGDLDQPLGGALQLAGGVHAAGIAMPAVEHEGHVDVDDVAFAQRLLVRDAVADDVVDRGAARLAVAAIVERGGQRAVVQAKDKMKSSIAWVVTPGLTMS